MQFEIVSTYFIILFQRHYKAVVKMIMHLFPCISDHVTYHQLLAARTSLWRNLRDIGLIGFIDVLLMIKHYEQNDKGVINEDEGVKESPCKSEPLKCHRLRAVRPSLWNILRNVGAVGFIGILLIMAGIESNPGPTPASNDNTSLDASLITQEDDCSLENLNSSLQSNKLSKKKKLQNMLSKRMGFKQKSANSHTIIEEDSEEHYSGRPNYIDISDVIHIALDTHSMSLNISNSTFQDSTWSIKEDELENLLNQDELRGLLHVSLNMCDLNKIPSTLVKHSQSIFELNLANNSIKEIDALIDCQCLKILNVSSNAINSLPDNIEQLKDLENIDITENPIFEIPSKLGKCAKLRYLKFGSKRTHVIALEVLQKHLNIDLPKEYREFLIYPQAAVLKDHAKIDDFIKKQEKKVQGMMKQITQGQGLCNINYFSCCELRTHPVKIV